MTACLAIGLGDRHRVTVGRNAEVQNALWLRVWAEWGVAGPDPDAAIIVPIERFLANLQWLLPACRAAGTGIEWDDGARAIVRRALTEATELDRVIASVRPWAADEVDAALAGGRFTRTLQPFQVRDLGKLLALPHGANFSVPGAGKTTVTYALYEAKRLTGRVDRLLVVCPISAYDSWTTEATDCFAEPLKVHRTGEGRIPADAEVYLVNYQRLLNSYETVARWAQGGRCHIVLDEAHRMKRGRAGGWGRVSLDLAHLGVRRDALTGTPAPQALRDLDAIFDFAWPSQARRILPPVIFDRSPPKEAAHLVADRIAPLFVRTTKSELNLRTPDRTTLRLPLTGLQREIYAALRDQYAGRLPLGRSDRSRFARMGQVVMYLLEAATNPRLLPFGDRPDPLTARPHFPLVPIPPNAALADLVAKYDEHENPPKFERLAQILSDNIAQRRKTLVWTNFVSNIELLEVALKRLDPAVIHGGVPSDRRGGGERTRDGELAKFRSNDNCWVLLANPAATSEGVSLHHDCHDAVYLDRTFNAGQYLQSVDRIHRLGMAPDQATRITFLVTEGTIDETVNQRVLEKAERLGSILRDRDVATMALPDEEHYAEVIAEDDLAAIFAHLSGEDRAGSPEPGS